MTIRDCALAASGEAPALHTAFEDVDGDGIVDLAAQFETLQTGIAYGDTQACVRGVFALTEFVACDTVSTVPPGM